MMVYDNDINILNRFEVEDSGDYFERIVFGTKIFCDIGLDLANDILYLKPWENSSN